MLYFKGLNSWINVSRTGFIFYFTYWTFYSLRWRSFFGSKNLFSGKGRLDGRGGTGHPSLLNSSESWSFLSIELPAKEREEQTGREEICHRVTDHLCSTDSLHYDAIITVYFLNVV